MGGFNFVASFKKQMAKAVHGEPVKRYAHHWEQLKASVPKRGAPEHKEVEEVKRLLKSMLALLVDEAKETAKADDDALKAAPPIYELLLKQGVLERMCEMAKIPGFDVPMVHHLTDVVLFTIPLFGHFKKVTAPFLDLLQFTEGRIQPWEANESTRFDYAQRCLAHGFIQLVHAISWQLRYELSAVECVDFFFVDRRRLEFDDSTEDAVSSCFVLLDFSLPFIRRKHEVVAAQEVDFTHDLRDPADLAHQLYTSEIALDALMNILNIPSRNVDAYLESKADLIAEMVCKSLQDLIGDYVSPDPNSHDDEYESTVVLTHIRRRLELINEVAMNPCGPLIDAFVRSFTARIVLKAMKKNLNNLPTLEGCASLLRLASLMLEVLQAPPFSDLIVGLLLGVTGPAETSQELADVVEGNTILSALLATLAGGGEEDVDAVLGICGQLLLTRPTTAADVLIAPDLHAVADGDAETLANLPNTLSALFLDTLTARCPTGLDPKYLNDQYLLHLRLQTAYAAETLYLPTAAPVRWTPRCTAPRPASFLASLVQMLGNVLDAPLDNTISLLNILTLCLHLNCDKLTWYLFANDGRESLTLVQALISLRTVIDGVRQEDELAVFKLKLEEARRNCGIVKCQAGYEGIMPDTAEVRLLTAALALEEWRRELLCTLEVTRHLATVADMKPAADAPVAAAEEG